ncbi:DUF805 domain-containing protein [Hansschlegelia quercus]|uniref:DUF805 domain-containing protein n=1 Tax=Hansschlegelia quercus TaxID=2528245 RepID=A0A4Q9GJG0_9HYPH|nr:DUF805 domain-containing protein [Hansschlegelia quercus]TBN53401.1 DUF805 domain-containing protein [Hansschlegelia quercus]
MIRRIAQDYFSFSGRLPRGAYWLRSVVSGLIGAVLAGLAALVQPVGLAIVLPLATLAFVGSLVIAASLVVRRFHDLGRRGWAGLAVVMLAGVASYAGQYGLAPWAASVFAAVVSLALFVYLGFVRGTKGDNAYGPDPLG